MSATPYTLLIARLRILGNDTATSNPKFGDTPQGVRDGTNKTFRLAAGNPVAGSIYYTYGATVRATTGFTLLDQMSGYMGLAAAPDAGTTQPFFFDYFFQWFADADYQDMIDDATLALGGIAGQDLPEGAGLYPAQIQYALANYWDRRASATANMFASHGGSADAHPETVTNAFRNLAKDARKNGDTLRDAFYKRFGKRNAPASATVTYGFDLQTPPR